MKEIVMMDANVFIETEPNKNNETSKIFENEKMKKFLKDKDLHIAEEVIKQLADKNKGENLIDSIEYDYTISEDYINQNELTKIIQKKYVEMKSTPANILAYRWIYLKQKNIKARMQEEKEKGKYIQRYFSPSWKLASDQNWEEKDIEKIELKNLKKALCYLYDEVKRGQDDIILARAVILSKEHKVYFITLDGDHHIFNHEKYMSKITNNQLVIQYP